MAGLLEWLPMTFANMFEVRPRRVVVAWIVAMAVLATVFGLMALRR